MSGLVLVGCWDIYGSGKGNGFVIGRFNQATGSLEQTGNAFADITVGQACIDRRRNLLFFVDERVTLPGYFRGGGGRVLSARFDPRTGALTEVSRVPSFGSAPCHLALDPTGGFLVVVHHTERNPVTRVASGEDGQFRIHLTYDDATTVLFPVGEDGALGQPCDVFIHKGDGGPLPRQTHPQLHSVACSPSGKTFAVCDKGNDEIQFFGIDYDARRLRPLTDRTFRSAPGSSPRYTAFHPRRPLLFVNHETKALVSSLRFDEEGAVVPLSSVSVLPDGAVDDPNVTKQSDLKIHPSGLFLFTLIRGTNDVSVVRIGENDGRLELIQTVKLEGRGPRGCAISPNGRFLLVACLESHEVLILEIGPDGALSFTGRRLTAPNAGCVEFL